MQTWQGGQDEEEPTSFNPWAFYKNLSHLNDSKFSINSGKAKSVPTQTEKLMRKNLEAGSSDDRSAVAVKAKKVAS